MAKLAGEEIGRIGFENDIPQLVRASPTPLLNLSQQQVRTALPLLLAVAGNAAKAFPGVGTLAGGLMHAVAYGLIFDALGRAVVQTLETRGELRPAPASLTFRDNLVADVDSQASKLLRLALDIRKEQGDNKQELTR